MTEKNGQKEINERNKEDIQQLFSHADIANREMGIVQTDIAWIKAKLEKVDTRTWWILAAIIATAAVNILIQLWLKTI